MNEESGAARPPRPPWWLGPIGVLLGSLAAIAILTFGQAWSSPAVLPLLAFLPALGGYALRVVRRATAFNLLSSVGTGLGWIVFISLLASPLEGTRVFSFIVIGGIRGLPWGIVVGPLVALSFILLFQWLGTVLVLGTSWVLARRGIKLPRSKGKPRRQIGFAVFGVALLGISSFLIPFGFQLAYVLGPQANVELESAVTVVPCEPPRICTQRHIFSFNLTNSGGRAGSVTVSFWLDGGLVHERKYYVPAFRTVGDEYTIGSDCGFHLVSMQLDEVVTVST